MEKMVYTLPMTQRQRKFLVLFLIAFFFLITPIALLYSQGYRFDWQTKTVTQTGAFFIKAIPSRVDVSINNVFKKKTDYIFDSTLVGDLLPSSYVVRVSKDQYLPWVKILPVKPREITEAKNIVLFPEQINFRVLFQNITHWWPSPDNTKIIFEKDLQGQKWQLVIWDPTTNNQRVVVRQKTNEDIFNIIWAQDSSRFILQTAAGETPKNAVWSSSDNPNDQCQATGCQIPIVAQSATNFAFAQTNGELFYLSNAQALTKINYLVAIPATTVVANSAVTFLINGNTIAWLDANGIVWQQNLSFNSAPSALNSAPFPVLKETPYALLQFGSALFLKESQTLFMLSESKTFEKISDSAKIVVQSPEKDKLLLSDDSHIFVYYLQNQNSQPFLKAETLELIVHGNNLSNDTWLTNYEIAFTQGNALHATETDTRDSINSVKLGTFQNPEMLWHNPIKTVFVLSEGSLNASEKLLR